MGYLLRTCGSDGSSHGGFRWPLRVGAAVEAPDWDPSPRCGGGLHGLLSGEGDGSLLNWSADAVWLVVEVDDDQVVDLDGEVYETPSGYRYNAGPADNNNNEDDEGGL